MKYLFAAIIIFAATCGTTQHVSEEYLHYTGSTQVMAEGTRSETVIFENFETGERYALVGELARELVSQSGLPVAITAVPTEEGWSMDPDLQKLRLIEYVIIETEEDAYE